MVREKLHIIIAMSTSSKDLRQNLRDYPCILNCCNVNWFTAWPPDALHFVSKTFLKEIEFTPEELAGCIQVSEYFHSSATEMVNYAYENDISYNCITPASFLELNSLFKTLLMRKRNEVNDIRQRYTVGLEKIKDAAGQVGVMQGELEAIQPHLTDASREVDKSVALVEKDLNEVSELEKIVKNEDAVVTEKTKQANSIRQDCQEDLAEVLTAVDTALDELNGLSQQEFAAVRGLKQPTISIKLIMEAICILKGVKPDRLPDSGAGGKMIDDYWGPSKRLLGDQRFASDLAAFEKDDISPKTMKLLREKYLSNQEIDPEVSKQNIGTGDAVISCLYKWLAAVESYDKVAKTVAPKKEALIKLNLELEEATKSLKEKQAVFDEANEKLKVLQTELAAKKAKKAELENEVETCSRKLERAEQLIGGLGGERDKWAEIVGNLGNKFIRLTGDILLSAAMVAYLGSFGFKEREAKLREWMTKCRECNVPFSDPEFLRNLESSIQFGQPALLENVGETLDPVLEPLLTKQTFKQGGSVCLKLGDSTLEYHKDFKLYITTKLRKPKIARDTVSKVALINFCITTLGLDEQLLTITVTRERPELEEERAQLIVQANDNRKQLRDIENKILEVLYSSQGNILEDENAIKILSSSKVLANEITEKQNLALESRKKIDENRAPYMQVAAYVGVLFFTISRLNAINHMYQYSLSWFINLFCNSIDLADKSEELDERLQNIQDHVTLALYQTVSRGLFDQDRPLFSFLLCINILQQQAQISDAEWSAFVDSELPADSAFNISSPNTSSHFDQRFYEKLKQLAKNCSIFKDVVQHIKENEEEWSNLCERSPRVVLESQFPGTQEFSLFQKLLLLKCINPTNLVPAVYGFVEQHIGKAYISFPLPDINKAYGESSCITPILFVLGETTDPSNAIYELAERLNIVGKRLQFVCLGYGKERHAEDLLREGIQAGNWVILQNCHMVPEWLARWVCDC